MTAPGMKNWIDRHPDAPIAKSGTNGSEYEIFGIKFVDYMISVAKDEVKRDQEKAAKLARLAGIEFDNEDLEHYDIDELLKVDRAQDAAQRRKIAQRRFVPNEAHIDIVIGLINAFRNGVRNSKSQVDRAGKLPPKVAAQLDEVLNDLLIDVHDRVGQLIEAHENGSGDEI